jgi:hypothetical protein
MARLRRTCFVAAVGLSLCASSFLWAETPGPKSEKFAPTRAMFGNPICAAQCAADVIADGFVDIDDLLSIINGWGVCVTCPPYCSSDAIGLFNQH